MNGLIILSGITLVPTLLILWRRSHGPLTFMSVCFGYVLVTFAAPDVAAFLTGFMGVNVAIADQWVKLGLLLTPVVLTLLFTGHAVSKHKLLLNLVPALATGMLLALLLVPLLPSAWQHVVGTGGLWSTLQNLQTDVLLAGGAFSLLYLFLASRDHSSSDDKKTKHK
jgi:hypothetical protein